MPFNGSGVFSHTTAGTPVVTNTVISSTMFNATLTETATGLTTCIAKDGQSTTTASIPFAAGISVTGTATFNSKAVLFGTNLQLAQGNTTPAANDLTLPTDGNIIGISGNTQINRIVSSGWQDGSMVTLIFSGTPTVKHNQAASGANQTILLNGGVDFVAAANNTLTLVLFNPGTTSTWYEVARKV